MADVMKTNVMHNIIEIAHLLDNITPEEVGVMLKLVDIFLFEYRS